jgi:hypothetical protein
MVWELRGREEEGGIGERGGKREYLYLLIRLDVLIHNRRGKVSRHLPPAWLSGEKGRKG